MMIVSIGIRFPLATASGKCFLACVNELGQDDIIPLEECAVVNLGDGQPGNELEATFSSGIAVFGEHWKKRFYDSNGDCFIDALDLIDLIEAPSGGIMDATRTLEEFSTFWFD